MLMLTVVSLKSGTAVAITVDYFRARAFASMAARFASIDTGRSASLIDEAEQAADNLTGRFKREDALAGIADEFLANYQPALGSENEELISRLHRIIGKALIGDGWYFSLPALGRISSEAITAVCEKLQLEADAASTAT